MTSRAEYADVIAALRGFGQQSACLLPLATALGPVGLIAFASSREGTYSQCDTSFLRHIGALVAMAIDNERHQQEAVTRERQLQAERDHWRTLLEVTNAVVTQRDVAALRAAIAPNVRRIVPHDHTNLYLIDEQRQLGPFVIDPTAPAWPDELATQIRLDREPYKSWLAPFDRAVDVDVTHADPTGWEALHAHVVASGVKRICNAPLATSHRVLGILSLGRLTPTPFTSDELGWVAQIAEQIALALENALAFSEIASLKDRLASREHLSGRRDSRRPAFRRDRRRKPGAETHLEPGGHGGTRPTPAYCCSARPARARSSSRGRFTPRATAGAGRS